MTTGELTQIFDVAKRNLKWGRYDYWDKTDDTHCAIGAIRHVTNNHSVCIEKHSDSRADALAKILSDAVSDQEGYGVVYMNDHEGWNFEEWFKFCEARGI